MRSGPFSPHADCRLCKNPPPPHSPSPHTPRPLGKRGLPASATKPSARTNDILTGFNIINLARRNPRRKSPTRSISKHNLNVEVFRSRSFTDAKANPPDIYDIPNAIQFVSRFRNIAAAKLGQLRINPMGESMLGTIYVLAGPT